MRQPAHAYSSLSITIHRRAGKQFAEGMEISPRRCGAAFAVAAPAPHVPGSRPAARRPFPGEGPRQRRCSAVLHRRTACMRRLLPSRPARRRGAGSGRGALAAQRPGRVGPADAGTAYRRALVRGTGPHPRTRVASRSTARNGAGSPPVRGPWSADRRRSGPATARPGTGTGRSGRRSAPQAAQRGGDLVADHRGELPAWSKLSGQSVERPGVGAARVRAGRPRRGQGASAASARAAALPRVPVNTVLVRCPVMQPPPCRW